MDNNRAAKSHALGVRHTDSPAHMHTLLYAMHIQYIYLGTGLRNGNERVLSEDELEASDVKTASKINSSKPSLRALTPMNAIKSFTIQLNIIYAHYCLLL